MSDKSEPTFVMVGLVNDEGRVPLVFDEEDGRSVTVYLSPAMARGIGKRLIERAEQGFNLRAARASGGLK